MRIIELILDELGEATGVDAISIVENPAIEVDIPYVEEDGDHEGRHRAYAAEKAGFKKIPVKTPPPQSWRTDKVTQEFTNKRFPNHQDDYKKSWERRIKRNPFPEETMDNESRKAFGDAINKYVKRTPDQEVRDTFEGDEGL